MAKPPRPPDPAATLRRRQRVRILASLIDICGQLERLKVSPEARRACREVAGMLAQARARETGRARK